MFNVAVVGATGAVGREMISGLAELGFPVKNLVLMASGRSHGTVVETPFGDMEVQQAEPRLFSGIDVAFFSAGASTSRALAPEAAKAGAVVIDNSSAFRMDPKVPLVVPEVNMEAARSHQGIIANPNCSTIILVVAIAPIHRAYGVSRIVVSTYQAVSGAGYKAMEGLRRETLAALDGREVVPESMPFKSARIHHQIALNLIPHVDEFTPDGYTKEEHKMVNETRKILGDDSIGVNATTVRVPVMRCHSESVNLQTRKPAAIREIRSLLETAPGVKVVDDPENYQYPMPINASNQDLIYVGRLREDSSAPNSVCMWIVGDQLRKGAATNAIQIAQGLFGGRMS